MAISDEWKAIADRAIRQTFERSSIAWQAIPHWDIQSPGQSKVRSDRTVTIKNVASAGADLPEAPFVGESLPLDPVSVTFRVTLGQATADWPDALLGSVQPRAAQLARLVDERVLKALRGAAVTANGEPWFRNLDLPDPPDPRKTLTALVGGRQVLEDSGFRADSCLIASTEHFVSLNQWTGSSFATEGLLVAGNVNSLHRASQLSSAGVVPDAQGTMTKTAHLALMLGRRQQIEHGCAASAAPGDEPIDLAVSVLPGLEVIGEAKPGEIELAVHIQFATRVKDERGVVVFHSPPQ